jgi:hypothetical protein
MSFSPKVTSSEIAKIRLAIAIRSTIKISRKVLFYVCKTLKNGALWVAYKIDGVKCSTFVSRNVFEEYVKDAAISKEALIAYVDYVKDLFGNYPNLKASYSGGIVEVLKTVPDRIKDITLRYGAVYDEGSQCFRLYVDNAFGRGYSKVGMKFVQEFATMKELSAHLAR